jgi:Ni/Fe-hydrogenase subunit HybB-like protein
MHQYEKVGRMALLSALFALVAGMLFVWIDLGHPWRFWKVFTRWNYTSVLAWEVLAYLFYIATLGIELWALMRCDLAHLALTVSGWRGKLYTLAACLTHASQGAAMEQSVAATGARVSNA